MTLKNDAKVGQIYEKGPNKFMVRVYLGRDDTGKKNFHSKVITGKTQADALKKAEKYRCKIIDQKEEGKLTRDGKTLFGDHVETWLGVVKGRVKSEKTYFDYQDRLRLYVLGADDEGKLDKTKGLGRVRLDRIDAKMIQEIYNKMLDQGLSARSVRYVHTLLVNCFQLAVKWRMIHENPAALCTDDLPATQREEMKYFTPEQAAKFMKEAEWSPLYAFFSLLIASGMRPGEALGLKWSDVDFKNNRVTVNRSLIRFRKGGWELKDTKTGPGRTIPLPSSTIKDLREHKDDQNEYIMQTKPGQYNSKNFVFAAENGEPLSDRNINQRHFKPILKRAELPDIRLYDLRHTCATLLLSAGENPKIVAERLGHKSITMTMDVYSHVMPTMQQGASDKLEGMLYNVK